MNGRNKKFLDDAFFMASASDFKYPLDRYPLDHHPVLFYLSFSDLDPQDKNLGSSEGSSGAGVLYFAGIYL